MTSELGRAGLLAMLRSTMVEPGALGELSRGEGLDASRRPSRRLDKALSDHSHSSSPCLALDNSSINRLIGHWRWFLFEVESIERGEFVRSSMP